MLPFKLVSKISAIIERVNVDILIKLEHNV